MSSTNLNQNDGFKGNRFDKFSSNSLIRMMACGGVFHVGNIIDDINMMFIKANSARCIKLSVNIALSVRLSKASLITAKPSCGILGYKSTTSIV